MPRAASSRPGTIHSGDDDVSASLAEMRRVLRPGGLVLLGFQSGDGQRDVGEAYRRRGLDVVLVRYCRRVAWMSERLAEARLSTVAVLEREAAGMERDDQGFVIARAQ